MSRYPPVSSYPNKTDEDGRRLCRNCEKPVAKKRRHYCSETCMNTFIQEHTWSLVRKDVLRRDNYRCSICRQRKRKKALDIDHIIPSTMCAEPFNKDNLRTLCKDCHKAKTKLDRLALHDLKKLG